MPDEEGNISLRGSGNIQIYINGRPTSLFSDDTESVLEQYPASLVKEVELITNPSARYEAEGVGGIINIILREERMQGFNGRINLSSGTGDKYNGGINLNYRTNNWNFFGNYSYQYREMWEQTNSFRENFISDLSPVLDQDYYNENWIRGQMLRTGAQYNINGNSSIQLYSNINYNNRGSLSYLLGLRGEYTHMESWQDYGLRSGFLDDVHFVPARDTITTDSYFRLFPSVFLSYELPRNQDIQASYSRRIRRPGIGSMMPFLNAQDFFNLRLGNPYLHPSHTDNYEINYLRGWQRFMLTAGVFHRRTTDDHSRLFVLFDKGSLVTWTNANTQNSTGVEVIQYLDWSNNLDLTLTGNFFYSEVSSEVEGRQFSNESYSWTLNLQSSVNIPGWFSSQVSANYWGPRVIPQGEIKPVFSLSAGFRRNVLNNQGTVSFNITDVFNSRKFSLETTNDQFFQQREFFRESRILTLGFIYRFGGFRERDNGVRDNSFERDIEGLY